MAVARGDYDHFVPSEQQALGQIIDVHFNATQVRYKKVRNDSDSQSIPLIRQYIRSGEGTFLRFVVKQEVMVIGIILVCFTDFFMVRVLF